MQPNDNDANWSYHPNDEQVAGPAQDEPEDRPAEKQKSVSWTASEFIANHKDTRWHIAYYAGLITCVVLIYLFTGRDVISSAVVAIVGILFVYLANHKPRQLPYEINNQGISVGTRFYSFTEFKSFGIDYEGAIGCINFLPLKRLMPELSIYFPPDQEDKIIDLLSEHLPNDQREEKKVDRLMKKIRF